MITYLVNNKQALVHSGPPSRLPIVDRSGAHVGALRLLDYSLAADDGVVSCLAEWRRRYMKFFLTHFQPSVDRTRHWLLNTVLPAEDRLFFLIETEPNSFVGNFGLANVSASSAELDNLIRGQRGGGPEFIYLAECAMLWWLFSDAPRASVDLHVFSTNSMTIRLHTSVGFEKTTSEHVFVNPKGRDHGFVLTASPESAGFSYDRMAVSRNRFLAINSWVADAFGQHCDHPRWPTRTT